jgi:hypothetical protein
VRETFVETSRLQRIKADREETATRRRSGACSTAHRPPRRTAISSCAVPMLVAERAIQNHHKRLGQHTCETVAIEDSDRLRVRSRPNSQRPSDQDELSSSQEHVSSCPCLLQCARLKPGTHGWGMEKVHRKPSGWPEGLLPVPARIATREMSKSPAAQRKATFAACLRQ